MTAPGSGEHELFILRLSKQGEGVAELEGRTVFIEGAIPGERVLARVDTSGKVFRAELLSVLEPSPARRKPACPVADRCGGCDWLHIDEGMQRSAKEEIVLSALEHLGQIQRADVPLLPTLSPGPSMAYRRRAVLHFSKNALGFYERKSHQCVPIEACPALVPTLGELPARLAKALSPLRSDAEAVHLLSAGGKVAFAVLLSGLVKPKHREVAEKAVATLRLAGAVLVPKEGSPVTFGKPALKILAPGRPEVPLYLRPDAFSQANEEGNEPLVSAAVEALQPSSGDRVLELFSGNGNFTFAIASGAANVVAVESGSVSVELARRSAAEAGVANVRFVLGDARKVCDGLTAEGERFDRLLIDPPRSGAPGVGRYAQRLGVRRIVYVACDPVSLARDASDLWEAGYRPASLRLVDMFPQTHHVEAVMAFDSARLPGR